MSLTEASGGKEDEPVLNSCRDNRVWCPGERRLLQLSCTMGVQHRLRQRRSCKMEIGKSNSTGQWRLNEPATVSDELHQQQQQQQQQSAQCLQKQTVVSSSSHSNATINVSHYSVSPYLYHILVLVLLTAAQCADGCSSRSTPKPRPSPGINPRPNITFQTYACPPAYEAWYCLNGATCFTVKIADTILYNCECADGYMGQRCEFKDLNHSYQFLPTREKLLMGMGLVGKTSSRVGPVFLAVLIIIVAAAIVSFIVTRTRTRAKKARIMKQQQASSPDTISSSSLDCVSSSPSSILQMQRCSLNNYQASKPSVMDMSVLGQSISYSLSHQQRYPYSQDYYHQGAELRSIHRHDTNRNHCMMISSRIPAKHHA